MSTRLHINISLALALLLTPALLATVRAADPAPLPNAHAHNDYEHKRPLLDALANGFCSVEADIYLVDGKLLVAHDRKDLKPDRTLQTLYLDPLLERVRKNKGRVYPGGPEFTLLIDIKTGGADTYRALSKILTGYKEMLTGTHDNKTAKRAVNVIVSGNRAKEVIAVDNPRFAGIDGRLSDLEPGDGIKRLSSALMPLISDRWTSYFKWRGEGELPVEEKKKLVALVKQAHQAGQRIRFWATPDKESVWRALHAAEVDLINTDDLPGLAKFLRSVALPKKKP